MSATETTFTYNTSTATGHILGGGWSITYRGFDLLGAWMAANADGFYLAPAEQFRLAGPTQVVRD